MCFDFLPLTHCLSASMIRSLNRDRLGLLGLLTQVSGGCRLIYNSDPCLPGLTSTKEHVVPATNAGESSGPAGVAARPNSVCSPSTAGP
jgi:hypothetical protein